MASILVKLLVGYFVTIQFTQYSEGEIEEQRFFEIKSADRRQYLLTYCHIHVKNGFSCRCTDIGRQCNETDTINCGDCRCLTEDIRTFYIKKRYGSICVSGNQLQYSAGFGDPFVIFNEPGKVCATIKRNSNTIKYVYHTDTCNISDPYHLWFWTPGHLLMNVQTFQCLDAEGNGAYRNLKISRCDSGVIKQKYKCNEKFWFGISDQMSSGEITYLVFYWSRRVQLLVRHISYGANNGKKWTRYPTNNSSVCSSAITEAAFKLANHGNTSQIDFLACLVTGKECSQLLYTSYRRELSDCRILLDKSSNNENQTKPSFALKNRKSQLYIQWRPKLYSHLVGMSINLTIECLTENYKLKEFYLSFGFKSINYKILQGCYLFKDHNSNSSNITNLDHGKSCSNSSCSKQLDVPLSLNTSNSLCTILWTTSVIRINTSTWIPINESNQLFFISKDENNTFYLQWHSADISLLKGMVFNLTIFCYDDKNQNFSVAETSCLVFQTEYKSILGKSAHGKQVPLEIILPVVFLVILLIVVIIFVCYKRRVRISRPSMKTHESRVDLSRNMNNASSNELNNFEGQGEDNPYYEGCIKPTRNPAVTIARNQLYEQTNPTRPISDIYEKPVTSVQAGIKAFHHGKPPQTGQHGYKKPKSNPVKPYKKKNGKYNDPQPNDKNQHMTDEFYDQPLSVIPNSKHGNNHLSPPSNNCDNRLSDGPYIKTLPREPEDVYHYATREEFHADTTQTHPTNNPDENVLSMVSENDMYGTPTTEAPFYDVLDYTHGKT